MVGKRRRLLDYLERTDLAGYRQIVDRARAQDTKLKG